MPEGGTKTKMWWECVLANKPKIIRSSWEIQLKPSDSPFQWKFDPVINIVVKEHKSLIVPYNDLQVNSILDWPNRQTYASRELVAHFSNSNKATLSLPWWRDRRRSNHQWNLSTNISVYLIVCWSSLLLSWSSETEYLQQYHAGVCHVITHGSHLSFFFCFVKCRYYLRELITSGKLDEQINLVNEDIKSIPA